MSDNVLFGGVKLGREPRKQEGLLETFFHTFVFSNSGNKDDKNSSGIKACKLNAVHPETMVKVSQSVYI